jgi:hypothetical protein
MNEHRELQRLIRRLPSHVLIQAPSGRWCFRGSVREELADSYFETRREAIDALKALEEWDQPAG